MNLINYYLKIMKYALALILFILPLVLSAQQLKLVWSDEFNTPGLPDNKKWGYDIGGSGWGNNELEYYTKARLENARIEDTVLIVEARKESYEGKNFTSARLVTKNKGDWKYGRIEVKAKLPGGAGTWPAIWMLPTDSVYGTWPKGGEIDIMEHIGFDPAKVYGTIHTDAYNFKKGTQKGAALNLPDAENAFHIYAINWDEDKIEIFCDSVKYNTFNNEHTGYSAWPFDKPFYLIFNIAVGGDWGGIKGVNDSIFPQKMLIDYVRIYEIIDTSN